MTPSRIPSLSQTDFHGMQLWFSEMQANDLLFHPDDDPKDIISIKTGQASFSDVEIQELRFIIDSFFENHGDQVYEAAYPIFMHATGQQLDA